MGKAFPLYVIMMMWEFADSEGLEHFVEGVYSMISYTILKNSIIHTDLVRNTATSSIMSNKHWKLSQPKMLSAT